MTYKPSWDTGGTGDGYPMRRVYVIVSDAPQDIQDEGEGLLVISLA